MLRSEFDPGLKKPRSPYRISGAAKLFLARGVICVLLIRFHPRIKSMYSCLETICRWFTSSLSVLKSHFSFRKHEPNKNKHIGDRGSLSCNFKNCKDHFSLPHRSSYVNMFILTSLTQRNYIAARSYEFAERNPSFTTKI